MLQVKFDCYIEMVTGPTFSGEQEVTTQAQDQEDPPATLKVFPLQQPTVSLLELLLYTTLNRGGRGGWGDTNRRRWEASVRPVSGEDSSGRSTVSCSVSWSSRELS